MIHFGESAFADLFLDDSLYLAQDLKQWNSTKPTSSILSISTICLSSVCMPSSSNHMPCEVSRAVKPSERTCGFYKRHEIQQYIIISYDSNSLSHLCCASPFSLLRAFWLRSVVLHLLSHRFLTISLTRTASSLSHLMGSSTSILSSSPVCWHLVIFNSLVGTLLHVRLFSLDDNYHLEAGSLSNFHIIWLRMILTMSLRSVYLRPTERFMLLWIVTAHKYFIPVLRQAWRLAVQVG